MLYGREREARTLEVLVEDARAGRSGALCLRGEAGIGKSALLASARALAADGMLVLEATGVESEAVLPFAGLAQILAPVVHLLDAIPPPQAAALRSVLALGPPSPGDRFAAYMATLSVLLTAAAEQPVLVAVDDAHWLDDSTREALLFAVRRLNADPIALVFAARTGEPQMFDAEGVADLPVGALDAESARTLLCRDGAPLLADGVADVLVESARGNPLALIEVPLLLTEAQRGGAAPLDEPLPAGQSITRAFTRRAHVLPSATQRALSVAAASDDGRLDAIGAALVEIGLGVDDLVAAESAGLAQMANGCVLFVHPLARSVLYHEAETGARREAHRALAVALEPDPSRAAQRAWHLARAAVGPDEEAATALEEVGLEALARTSYAAAASALSRAAGISVDPAGRFRRTLGAAAAATVSGQLELAVALLNPVIEAVNDPVARAEALHMLGMAVMLQGRLDEASTIVERSADAFADVDPERSAAMAVVAGSIRAMASDSHAVLRFARRAAALAEQSGGPVPFSSDALLGYALCLVGDMAASEPHLARASTVLGRLDTLSPSDYASFQLVFPMLVFPIVWQGRYPDAHETIDRLILGCRTTGALSMLPILLGLRADLLAREGRIADAYVAAREALATATELRQVTMIAWAQAMLARVEAILGRDDDCRAHAARTIELAGSTGAHSLAIYASAALGLLALGRGDGHLALDHLRRTAELAEPNGLGHPGVVLYLADSVEAHLLTGREREAAVRLAVLEGMAVQTDHEGSLATLERCRGLLAPGAAGIEHLERAVERSRAAGEPFEAARSQLALGARLRRARRRGEAREPLEAARIAFERMGARPWQEQAEHELRAAGVGVHRSVGVERPALTVKELEVALRVSRGATNRETAAELLVSAKTVEFHLGRVYRKLGIRSRAELAALVAIGVVAPGSAPDEEHAALTTI